MKTALNKPNKETHILDRATTLENASFMEKKDARVISSAVEDASQKSLKTRITSGMVSSIVPSMDQHLRIKESGLGSFFKNAEFEDF